MMLQGLEADDHVKPGKVRDVNVSVGGYRCPDRRAAEFLLAPAERIRAFLPWRNEPPS